MRGIEMELRRERETENKETRAFVVFFLGDGGGYPCREREREGEGGKENERS